MVLYCSRDGGGAWSAIAMFSADAGDAQGRFGPDRPPSDQDIAYLYRAQLDYAGVESAPGATFTSIGGWPLPPWAPLDQQER